MTITVTLLPILNDNYCYLIQSAGKVGLVDPGEAGPVIDYLEKNNLKPDVIFNTHHHGDHIGGNNALIKRYGCALIGPAREVSRIPGMTKTVSEGDRIEFGEDVFRVIGTPGHTNGHICFFAEKNHLLFCGDTLFSLGCGRLFEGSAAQMWNSLQKLMSLPDDTLIYCGHEYTQTNGEFCLSQDPDNADLIARMEDVKQLRENGKPTLPVSLATEKKTNIFLRAGGAEKFKEFRLKKDQA